MASVIGSQCGFWRRGTKVQAVPVPGTEGKCWQASVCPSHACQGFAGLHLGPPDLEHMAFLLSDFSKPGQALSAGEGSCCHTQPRPHQPRPWHQLFLGAFLGH